ncbi:hypothetical protein [Microbispora bryophytorum]|uniref:Uncharacterized protein n=1 Tax=Microbispora bryophytorum TaxID=1460882 RepID=A0A8H9H5L9_9ACTN|nr:hypothetical protein [Microbispora bryophytorum]MBD3140733.1 hypothetical protein [Microbispora bryophytorum]TQS00770.1 hypothetical protein FLX07_32820 [Microbispora bryophytorum]GGO30968.1 hypothetical protein GCM10011574_68050 [Microbispora bryophytorum]
MSDWFQHSVYSRHAQMHMGPGDLHVNNYYFETLADRGGQSFRSFAADYLLWLRRNFVPPPRFGQAREILASQRTVLLDGAPGSGRVAAAQMLLHELRTGEDTFRELPLNDDESSPLLALDGIADDTLLLLDLSEVEEKVWMRAHEELHSVRAEVYRHQARLVVVLPYERTTRLVPALAPYRVVIGRPQELAVLRRYLRLNGLAPEVIKQPAPAVVTAFLGRRPPMEDIARFAGLVVDARAAKAGGAGDYAAWCQEAYAALGGREAEVADSLRELQDGSLRALLLATAMLHGAHADAVHNAAVSLLATLRHPEEDLPVLQHTGLVERFREIGAERDGKGCVRFKVLEFDRAVRVYSWTQLPELRAGLREWVGATVMSTELTEADRDELVKRFTELCLQDRYRQMLVPLVLTWTENEAKRAGTRAAVQLLTKGLQDQRQGWFFRRQIYEWSIRTNLSAALTEVIISLCTEVMAVHHPHEAVVRLHHMARREGQGTTRARDALTRLVRADRRLLRLMFDRLDYQFSGNSTYKADPDLFLELADPGLLTATKGGSRSLVTQEAVRKQLTNGWDVVFGRRPEDTWSPAARRWLLAAGAGGPYQDALLDVLIDGGARRTDVLARLYVMASELERSLPPPDESDVRFRDRVLQKINIVQGVQVA